MEPLITKAVTIFACVCIISFSSCTARTNYLIHRAIQKGTDPYLAYCALSTFTVSGDCLTAEIATVIKGGS